MLSTFRRGRKNISTTTVRPADIIIPYLNEPATVLLKLAVSPAPKNCAAITANPLVSPCKKPITRVFTELVEPTAASELSPNT